MTQKVAIIGGGAAGMMCAATIQERNPAVEVFLIEKNDILGKKVLISGGGRCNVTTGIEDLRTVFTKYPRGNKFLTSAMYAFPPGAVRAWFEEHGVPLKCEEDLRVFPISDNGEDVVGVFRKILNSGTGHILLKHNVQGIERQGGQFSIRCKDVEPIIVDAVVMALGGQAYRQTGSVGDGYRFAEELGHTVTPVSASLNSFITREKWPKELAGVSFERVELSTASSQKNFSFSGPVVFTHMGLSGPAVFALSAQVAFETYDSKHPLLLMVDCVPEKSFDEMFDECKAFILENPKKSLKTLMHRALPKSLVDVVCREFGLPGDKHIAEVSGGELRRACELMKRLPLNVIGRGAGDEFVTAGGVDTNEVDPRTMESKRCSGLYFVGEILNVDGFTGGFNLQASWATGRAAGVHIASRFV